MTDLLPDWINALTTPKQPLKTGLLILAALLVLAYLLRIPLRSWREKSQIRKAVKRIGAQVIRDVNLPEGMGSMINIDFLVLTAEAILVIGVKRYDGVIFGSARTDEWTQTINRCSYRFPNPDIHLAEQLCAVRGILPKVPVRGLHLFTDTALFPRDMPDNVLQVKDLLRKNTPRLKSEDIPADLHIAWGQLSKYAHQ